MRNKPAGKEDLVLWSFPMAVLPASLPVLSQRKYIHTTHISPHTVASLRIRSDRDLGPVSWCVRRAVSVLTRIVDDAPPQRFPIWLALEEPKLNHSSLNISWPTITVLWLVTTCSVRPPPWICG